MLAATKNLSLWQGIFLRTEVHDRDDISHKQAGGAFVFYYFAIASRARTVVVCLGLVFFRKVEILLGGFGYTRRMFIYVPAPRTSFVFSLVDLTFRTFHFFAPLSE